MDANNTPYFLLRTPHELRHGSVRVRWNTGVGALTLAQNQKLRLPESEPAAAHAAWQASTPLALDSFNQLGALSADRTRIEFNSGRKEDGRTQFLPLQDGDLANVAAPVGTFTDLALGGDGRLAAPYTDGAGNHGLLVFHLARRWQAHCDLSRDTAGAALAAPRRACVDADDRVWVVTAGHLLLCAGEPLPLPYEAQPARFEPETLNPRELRLHWAQPLPAGWTALALCADAETLYVLAHDAADNQAILTRARNARDDRELTLYACDEDAPFVVDLALAADSTNPVPGRLAALAPRQPGDSAFAKRDATLFELRADDAGTTAVLVHERYPLLSLAVPRFVSSADGQLRYQAVEDPDYPGFAPRPRELHALRRPRYHVDTIALLQQTLDSGQLDTHWHRLYLDAQIPSGCAIQISARVYATPEERGSSPLIVQPAPIWNPLPSELPFTPALAGREPGKRGLFEVLLQRPDGPMRRMSGRYLQIQLTLRGNGSHTPALHAIRVYCPRFSYQEAWLPEFLRQELSFDPANATGPANGADVRERLLAAFEGVLTPLEGRVAASDRLVHPDATPPEHLPWLAEMLGTPLPPHWPHGRQRRLVRDATLIQQYKGTVSGVRRALDIASDGGARRGEVVLVENFTLRRTMATILGVSMDDADHPLTLGTGMSGNSIVGDSLILSESDAREFLALFSPDIATQEEAAAVREFFEQYAHQVTVLLHGRGARLRGTVEDVLAAQMPAHVQWRIFETEHPFVLGTSPLLEVDTFVESSADVGTRRVELDDTFLGQEGVLKNLAAFSPADINTLGA